MKRTARLNVPSDHGVIRERVAVMKVFKNGASVGEERSVVGHGGDGDELRNGVRVLMGWGGFEEVGVDLGELL